jgi:hypothetical protein
MRWPWVSRERLADAIAVRDARISELTLENRTLTAERHKLMDFIAVRSNNLSIFGEVLPPREDEADTEPGKPEKEADWIRPVSRARAFAQGIERENIKRFSKEEAEAQRLIDNAIEEGRRAAEKNASTSN